MPAGITILESAPLSGRDREAVTLALRRAFPAPVRFVRAQLDLQAAYDVSRKQYNSSALLAQILLLPASAGEKILAVVDVDLFVPVLTFVFGEAQLDGTAGIVSSHRLANTFYGVEEDAVLRRERLGKEIVHELGHTFGLYHCRQFECVMRSSTYVEEIDLKRAEPCPACEAMLREKIAAGVAAG